MIVHDVAQRTPEWVALKLGIPSASGFHRLITAKTLKPSAQADQYMVELLAAHFIGEQTDAGRSSFMERGTFLEEGARRWYELQYDVEVQQVGFVTLDNGLAGCSPDGLVGTAGALEIKAPAATTHIRYLLAGDGLDGIDDDYRAQTQGTLYVTEREWIDCVSYNPVLPAKVVRVYRDDAFLRAFGPILDAFISLMLAKRAQLAALGCVPRTANLKASGDAIMEDVF